MLCNVPWVVRMGHSATEKSKVASRTSDERFLSRKLHPMIMQPKIENRMHRMPFTQGHFSSTSDKHTVR